MPMSPRLLRPRATGFNPKSISGLKLWLDVANTSSLTFNGSTVCNCNRCAVPRTSSNCAKCRDAVITNICAC